MNARVRGIYTTAVTRILLDAGHDVVQASDPIRDRFDATFETADHDVDVETTDDRQGVGVAGGPDAVAEAVGLLTEVGLDAFAWPAAAPRDAVFDARVTQTLGRGAVCDLGDAEGYLPFSATADRVETGDHCRVQVVDSAPPWGDDRPVLTTDLRVRAGLASLVRGESGVSVDTHDDEAGRELAGLTDLLDAETPEGWGLRWRHAATGADLDALSASLDRATDRAEALSAAVDDEDVAPSRLVAAPGATTWVWFGREARFGLDDRRREVTTTMAGHHRTKAASTEASSAVDLVEALCSVEEFPFEAVTDAFGPTTGDRIRIDHGKPDGRRIVLGRGEVVDRDPDGTVTLRREMTAGGRYDALDAVREDGDVAITKFREGRWWYPTVYRDDAGGRKGTYVNVCTPVECFPDALRYVDLHVDVVKEADGTVRRVDDDELDAAVDAGTVSSALASKARRVASSLENAL